MKEDKFIKEYSETWKNLENTLIKLKSRGIQKLEKNEIESFLTHYNHTCGHLSYSRTYYGNTSTTEYLNRLVASAHSYIYTTKSANLKKLVSFFTRGFPLLVKKNMLYIILSTSIFLLGVILSFVYTLISSDNAYAFLPKQYVDNVSFGGNSGKIWDSAIMSSFILTNNIKVGFVAFSLGVTLGIGTIYVLIKNGFMLGGLSALAHQSGYDINFWSLILPHGILELFAIFICGAAGLMIGYSLINPGKYSRKDSFILQSKTAAKLVCGTIPIFVVAGLIEGYITPLSVPETVKLVFALLTFVLLVFYLVFFNIRSNTCYK